MTVREYKTRRLYFLGWWARYSFAALVCFIASLAAIPDRRGLIALAVGYAFTVLAVRARRQAHQVQP